MRDHRRDASSDAAAIYATLFTSAGGDDKDGDLHGKDAGLCAQYRDWYRNLINQLQPISITYDKPSPGKSLGYFVRNPSQTKRTALIIHGITSSSQNTGPWVRLFYDLGFNILTPDLRGHGLNEAPPPTITDRNMGIYDSLDMLAWINKILEIVGNDAQIVLMGYSLGAAVALQTNSYTDKLPPNVKAVVEDSGFRSLPEMVAADIVNSGYELVGTYSGVDALLSTNQQADIANGISWASIQAGRLPLLVIYGDADTVVFPTVSEWIGANYGGAPIVIHKVPGATHPNCIAFDYQGYKSQVQQFLTKILLG